MRKIIATTFVSIDGVMQAPGGPDEDTSGDFRLGGWTATYWDDATNKLLEDVYEMPYDLLLGRRTYDIFASFWPNVEKDPSKPGYDAGNAKIGKEFDAATKYVATHTPETLGWPNTKWLGHNTVQSVKSLRAEDGGPLLIVGSSELFQTLMQHRLVDELRLMVFPVVLGKGKRLFTDGAMPSAFKIARSISTPSGVVAADYVAPTDLETGNLAESTEQHRDEQPRA